MSWRVALRLGRVSNLPTVVTNVLAATALARGDLDWRTAILCLAMSMMYVAGMYLNDAFDRDIDARERPERPIPSGQVSARLVFTVGFALLGGGVLVVALSGLGVGATVGAAALAVLIVFYDLYHKKTLLSPVVMGLCRAAVYLTAALAIAPGCPDRAVLVGAAALFAYVIGLTFIARAENLRELRFTWPLGFLAVPFVVALPASLFALVIFAGFLLWVARALVLVRGKAIRAAVTGLIAGIAIFDALMIANAGHAGLAVLALLTFLVTMLLQRVVPGT